MSRSSGVAADNNGPGPILLLFLLLFASLVILLIINTLLPICISILSIKVKEESISAFLAGIGSLGNLVFLAILAFTVGILDMETANVDGLWEIYLLALGISLVSLVWAATSRWTNYLN